MQTRRLAEVLWEANKLAAKAHRSDKDVETIVSFARTANKHELTTVRWTP